MSESDNPTDQTKIDSDSKPKRPIRGCAALTASGVRLGGRQKGVPNKTTLKAREAIQQLLDGSAASVQGWLDAVAESDPKAALSAYTALLEFGVPKLARTELTGGDGKSEPIRINVSYIQPKNADNK